MDDAAESELDDLSLYDSLLRGVAAGAPAVRIDTEVGPSGKFVLQQEIGSGAMGRVYRALDQYLLRDVAIKFILRPEGMDHDDFMALFWQEAHIIARLDQHDNIVRIFDVDRSSYPPFIVMEYLDGQSLEKLLRRGPVDLATALRVMIAVASGLREAHAKGVYHRDLKPSNIFVQNSGRVKLLDFGLARIRNHMFEASAARPRFAAQHAVPALASAGTPAYMAPEQWRGVDADPATDLWAMGAILYRLLARAAPFDGDSLAQLSARVLSGEPPAPLAPRCPDAPAEVCELALHMLRFERADRPASAADVIAVLEAALRTVGSSAQHAPAAPAPAPGRAAGAIAAGSAPDSPLRNWEKMLLVIAPGADSGVDVLPDRLSSWILHGAGVNLDVWHCPPALPGEVAEHAARLRATLCERFKRPRHICFVTHGEGTSVVLRMLLDEARRLRAGGEPDLRSPFYRARHVAILRPGRGVASARAGADAYGLPAAPLVGELVAETDGLLAANLPVPAVHYIGLPDDKRPLHPGSPAVAALSSLLVRPEVVLARETIAQTFELDCAARITSLVEPAGDRGELTPTVPGAQGATQAEVFDDVLAAARAQHSRPMVMVIAGDAGVGKSTVLRTAARRLSSEFVASADGAPLPVLVPLYFASLTSEHLAALDTEPLADKRGRVLHEILLDWWCDWLSDVTYAGAIDIDWIKARLRSEPVLLIFDGVDEFITNHPALGIADFQQMLALLAAEYRQNRGLTIVLGVRSTQPGLPLLASSNIREILRLTAAQAVRQFPTTSAWLATAGDAPIQKLLSTPLILAQLAARRPPSNLSSSTHGDVLLLALTTIIEQSDLAGKLDESGRPIDVQRWIDALMAVAWCLFRRMRGEIATSTLKFDGADLYRSWADHLARTDQGAQGEPLLAGFRLLAESRAHDALLRRTVLYPTGRGEVRFVHREWQDFLAARYLAQVVAFRHVDEFRHVGNTARISRMAGELLCQDGARIDEAFIHTMLAHARDTGASLITANFAALVTNSQILIEGPAIDAFLSAVHIMPAIARCITLIGLGYRALRGDDASAHDLRYYLVRVFRDYLAGKVTGDDAGVMRSVAWSYLRAYGRRFGGPALAEPWPGLDDAAERGALAMMCATTDDGPRFRAEHRSVQTALLELQQVVAGDPFRPISGVHYLYCLCIARRHGAGIAELGRDLPALLADPSPYAAAIDGYDAVPELHDILALCRGMELG